MRQRRAYSRAERKRQIILAFAIVIQRGFPNQLTAYDIARSLDVTPSPKLYVMLREMVADGELTTSMIENKGKWETWAFHLPEGTFQYPKKSPQIKIYNRGVLVNQLELF